MAKLTHDKAINYFKNTQNVLEKCGFKMVKDATKAIRAASTAVSTFIMDFDPSEIENPFWTGNGDCAKDLLSAGVEILSPAYYTRSEVLAGHWSLTIWVEVDYLRYHEAKDYIKKRFDTFEDLQEFLMKGI